jgi:hypothetical protein
MSALEEGSFVGVEGQRGAILSVSLVYWQLEVVVSRGTS